MSLLTQLKQLQTLEQQHKELKTKLYDLQQQREDLAKSILNAPNCPHEAHVPIGSNTIAYIEHSDFWDEHNLRDSIKFHEIVHLEEPDPYREVTIQQQPDITEREIQI